MTETQSDALEALARQVESLERRFERLNRPNLASLLGVQGGRTDELGGWPEGQVGGGPYAPEPNIAANAITANEIAAGSIVVAHMANKGTNLLNNSSFEAAPPDGFEVGVAVSDSVLPYWGAATAPGMVGYYSSSYARTGTKVLRIQGNGSASFPALSSPLIPVQPGRTYRLAAYMARPSGVKSATSRISTYDSDGLIVTTTALAVTHGTSTLTLKEGTYKIPADATVSYVKVFLFISDAAPASTDVHVWEDVSLVEVPSELANTPGEVVITPGLIAVTNGAITVTNGASVVIIDGTSNMFKIAAEGTLTRAFPATAGASAQSTVTVNNTTTGGDPNMCLIAVGFGTASSVNRHVGIEVGFNATGTDMDYMIEATWSISGTTNCILALTAYAGLSSKSGNSCFMKYYIFKEASI